MHRTALALVNGRFQFGPYTAFAVQDGKSRIIHAPPLEQRVIHRAMAGVLRPAFEQGALPHSHAGRPGRGHASAMREGIRWTRNCSWWLKMDVEKFYDSIPHEMLLAMLRRRFRERRLIFLFERLISSYETGAGLGLPMGALTSQLFGNFYLDPVDHLIVDRKLPRGYVRYLDDLFVWHHDRRVLLEIRDRVAGFFERLGLKIKNGGQVNRSTEGLPMLGLVVYPNRIRLDGDARVRLRRKCRALERAYRKRHIEDRDLQRRSEALFAWARQADDAAWRRAWLALRDFGETLEDTARDARRELQEPALELPVGLPQQEAPA
ncbi:MAG: group II intron reverse transcriptase domain-containing protein [Verrucomicrobiae bacterium]|nr:group II intron reverse transcriptase domain-containing protein [Verrucomicrobiae bacterium]